MNFKLNLSYIMKAFFIPTSTDDFDSISAYWKYLLIYIPIILSVFRMLTIRFIFNFDTP